MREVSLLGTPKVTSAGGEVPRFRSQRTIALLGYLVAERRTITRERLATLFWPDEQPQKAKGNLRRELYNLGQVLPGSWEMDRVKVRFRPAAGVTIDLDLIRQYEAAGEWLAAAELLRGEFLEGIAVDDNLEFETWLLGEQERWRQRAETILSRVINQHIEQTDTAAALSSARKLLALTPWNEAVHRQVMVMLARSGQRGAALRQFELCQEALANELGVEPAEETVRLFEQIKDGQLEPSLAGPEHAMPSGVVTFLFTDMVSSSSLWETFPDRMPDTLARHDALLRDRAISRNGYVFKRVGDGLCIAFQSATEALLAAVESQRALLAEPWGEIGPLRVRMALHSGAVEMRDGDYFGVVVNQVARLTTMAGGGQIVLSQATQALLDGGDLESIRWLDLGQRSFSGLSQPIYLYQAVVPGLPTRFASTGERLPGALPQRATTFVGRQVELAEIARLLESYRLVTLTGPGGIGKTRLALAAAEAQIDQHRDGVAFVPLLSLQAASAVIPAIAGALGLVLLDGRSQSEQLLQFLESRQMLLLLDNFEHLLADEILELVEKMLAAAPGLKILVTSREVLHVSEERVYQVYGLPVGGDEPDTPADQGRLAGNSAVELFLRRARRVRPDLEQATGEDIREIRHICHLVEGMPLAIELAAAQMRLLSLTEIVAELNQPLNVLDTQARGISDRHHSIRLVFGATWRSLEDRQQRIFASLSVFRGGFTRQAAREVAGATLSDLVALLDKSLVRRENSGRFVRHALIRSYAAERLADDPGKQDQAHRRHFDYYARILRATLAQWQITTQEASILALAPDTDNLLAAWGWILRQGDCKEVSTYLDDLRQFLRLRHRLPETIELLEEALRTGRAAEPAVDLDTQAHWERLLAESYTWLSVYEIGRSHFKRVVSLLDRPVPESETAMLFGLLKQLAIQGLHRLLPGVFIGRRQQQEYAIQDTFIAYEKLGFMAAVENRSLLAIYSNFRALNLAEDTGLPSLMAHAYAFTGLTFGIIPLRRIAESYLAWSRTLALADSSISVQERAFGKNAIYYVGAGQWDQAIDSSQRALTAAIELGQHWDEGIYLVLLHVLTRLRGQYDLAFTYADQISDTTSRNGDVGFEAAALYWKAVLRLHQGEAEQAIALLNKSASAPTETMNLFDWIVLRATLAQAYLRQSRKELAQQEADKVAELIAQMGRPSNPVAYDGYVGVTAVYLALWEDCGASNNWRVLQNSSRQALGNLRSFAKVFPIAGPRARLHQGQYEWLDGKRRKAYKAWAKSLAEARELGMPYDEGLVHFEIGRRLLEDGQQTDEGWGARQHLARARELFTELGANYDLCRAQAELERRSNER